MSDSSTEAFPLKALLFSLWMYLGGPLVWGAWMVWRLDIYKLNDFLACLWPLGLIIMALCFSAHVVNLWRITEPGQADRAGEPLGRIRWGFALMGLFGSLATLAFLTLPALFGLAPSLGSPTDWMPKAMRGSVAGLALVCLFYPFFMTSMLLKKTDSPISVSTLRRLSLTSFSLGVAAYVITVIFSGARVQEQILSSVAQVVPLAMGALLLWKTLRMLPPQGGETRTDLLRMLVRHLALGLFVGLSISEMERFWLPVLIAGMGTAFLSGHWYCGWICPVNTTASLVAQGGGPAKRGITSVIARFLQNKAVKVAWLVVLGAIFASCLLLGIRIKLFASISLAGIMASLLLPSATWCRNLCPWMAVMKLTEALPPLAAMRPPCHGCEACFKACRQRVRPERKS